MTFLLKKFNNVFWCDFANPLSFLLSISLWFSGQQQEGLYVGIWVPSILAAGAYVKQIFKKWALK